MVDIGSCIPLPIVLRTTSRWLSSTITAPSVPTLSIHVVANRLPHVGALGIEALRVADGELEAAFAGELDQFVGFRELERDRLLEEHVLAGGEAVARHREVRRLGRGGDVDRFHLADAEEL